jgi:hypothetical protein
LGRRAISVLFFFGEVEATAPLFHREAAIAKRHLALCLTEQDELASDLLEESRLRADQMNLVE